MRTCGALAPRSPSSWTSARDGRRPVSALLKPPRRRAQAPAPALTPSPPMFCNLHFIVGSCRSDGRSGGRFQSRESEL
eukprot:4527866-Pleurochrysis_carterae.AAC.1